MSYEEDLKTLTDEQLHNAHPVAAVVDFWKAGMILQEIYRRDKERERNKIGNRMWSWVKERVRRRRES